MDNRENEALRYLPSVDAVLKTGTIGSANQIAPLGAPASRRPGSKKQCRGYSSCMPARRLMPFTFLGRVGREK